MDNDDGRVGCLGKKQNGFRRVIHNSYEEEQYSPEVFINGNPIPRRMSKATEGEQIAAGWPAWLASVAGEAIQGWLPRRIDSFEKIDVIGRGTYSTVYKARDTMNGQIVALKKLRLDNLEPESAKVIAREILILRRLDHPNIIKLEGLSTARSSFSLYLIFECMEHDLTLIASFPGVLFTEPRIKCYMHQLLTGLEYCHSRGVLHRDIKGSNLLVDKCGTLKIADFGISTILFNRKRRLTSRVVTLWYRAPELILRETYYGVAIDLWSAGCVLGELCAGMPIMPGRTEIGQLHEIYTLCGSPSEDYWRNSKLPNATLLKPHEPYKRRLAEAFKGISPAVLALMETLLSFFPDDRGTATSALGSEFFTTKPFACDPSSLPRYLPSREIDIKRREKADSGIVLVPRGQRGDHDRKEIKMLQAPPARHAHAGFSGSMQMVEDQELQIQHAVQQARRGKHRPKFEVQGSPVTDNALYPAPSYVPSNNGIYPGPAPGPAYDVDQLLEEHDRHIQESATKWRLEKRRGAKPRLKRGKERLNT